MTYIKYQERKKEDFVDWSEIGKDMTDMLSKEGERRDKLRADIAQQSRDYANKIATAEQSNHTGLNEWWLDYGGQASDALLQLDRLFQSGQLKQKDYLAMRQNLMDGTDQALDLVENFSTLYDERMKRLNDGTSSWMEHKNFQELEGFMNFTDSRLSIDPSSYKVGLGFVDENGLPIKDNKTIADLYNRINATQDKYDLNGNLTTSVNRLAKTFEKYNGTIDDVRNNPKYKDAKKGYIDAMITSPYDAASIYGDYMNGDTDAVEMEWDPASGMYKPKLNDAQMKEVRDFLDAEIESMVSRKQKYVAPATTTTTGEGGGDSRILNRINLIDGIQSVTEKDFKGQDKTKQRDYGVYHKDDFDPYAKPKNSKVELYAEALLEGDLYSEVYYQWPYEVVDKKGRPDPEGEYRKLKKGQPMQLVIVPKSTYDRDGNEIPAKEEIISLGDSSFFDINKALNIGAGEKGKVYAHEFPASYQEEYKGQSGKGYR